MTVSHFNEMKYQFFSFYSHIDHYQEDLDEAADVDGRIKDFEHKGILQKQFLVRYLSDFGAMMRVSKKRIADTAVSISTPEYCIMCTLHMSLRVGECLLTKLIEEVLRLEKKNRLKVLALAEDKFKEIFSGYEIDHAPELEEIHQFSLGYNPDGSGSIKGIKMTDARQKKVWKRIKELMDIVFEGDQAAKIALKHPEGTPENYLRLFELYHEVKTALKVDHDVHGEAIDDIQAKIDLFCDKFIVMFGDKAVTNYMHTLRSGHVAFWLAEYGNIHRYNNSGLESFVGTCRSFYFKVCMLFFYSL